MLEALWVLCSYARPLSPGWTWDRRNPHVVATFEPDARIDYVFMGPRAAKAMARSSTSSCSARSRWAASGPRTTSASWPCCAVDPSALIGLRLLAEERRAKRGWVVDRRIRPEGRDNRGEGEDNRGAGFAEKRILVARLLHQTNTFACGLTGLEDFEIRRGEEMLREETYASSLAGLTDEGRGNGWELVPVVDMWVLIRKHKENAASGSNKLVRAGSANCPTGPGARQGCPEGTVAAVVAAIGATRYDIW